MSDLLKGLSKSDSLQALAPKAKMQAKVSPSQAKEVNSRPAAADSFLAKLNNDRETFQKTETSSKSDFSSTPISKDPKVDLPSKAPVAMAPVKEAQTTQSKEAVDSEVVVIEDSSPAMAAFLSQMEKEFKIKPEDLMNAFTSLSDEDLNKAPEENVEKLVQMLGLNPEQQVKAEKYFYEMLKNSESQNLGSYLKQTKQDVGMTVMTAAQAKEKQQLATLEQMNKNFFIDNKSQQTQELTSKLNKTAGQGVYQSQVVQENPDQQKPAAEPSNQIQFFASKPSRTGAVASEWKPNLEAAAAPVVAQGPTGVATKAIQPAQIGEVAPQVEAKNQAVQQLQQQAIQPQAPEVNLDAVVGEVVPNENSQKAIEAKIQEILSRNNPSATEAPAKAVAPAAAMMAAFGEMDSRGEQQGEATQNFSQMMGVDQKSQPVNSENGKPMFQINMNKPTEAQQAQNMNEVIKNAQLIASKGGGEMRIEMNPEGMGELHLKVAVKNGQVNVEMIAESSEAKKMIEKGMGDLKSSLAAQRLNVEGIKVDVAGGTSNELQNQFQNAERQMAQQFLQDFKRDNNNWRRAFTDTGEVRGPRSQIESGDDQSLQRLQAQSKRPGKRLDLVA